MLKEVEIDLVLLLIQIMEVREEQISEHKLQRSHLAVLNVIILASSPTNWQDI